MTKVNVLVDNDLDYAYGKLPNVSIWAQDMFTNSFNLFYQNSFIVKEDSINLMILKGWLLN